MMYVNTIHTYNYNMTTAHINTEATEKLTLTYCPPSPTPATALPVAFL